MGIGLYLAARAKRRGGVGGPGGEHLWPGSRGRTAPQRGAGGRRARLAGAACCSGIGMGPGHGLCRSRPPGQAIINGLS
jgi:hypothetical protein